MKNNVRINNDEYDKENVSDFALWKAYKQEDWDNYWEKEFIFQDEKKILKWRPGWHIECSACNMKYFWPQIDIHMGGVDNIFPHHENEIAQTEWYTWKTFSKYWIHGGHITVNGEKMSKSKNNFYTLRDLEEKFSHIPKSLLYRSIRLSFMNARYRENVDFSFEKLEQNFHTIKKIDGSIQKLARYMNSLNITQGPFRKEIREELQDFIWEYIQKLEDDFNTPEAFSIFFMYITFVNTHIDSWKMSVWEANAFMDMYKTFDSVFSILDFDILKTQEIPDDIQQKFDARNQAKKEKNFTLSDTLREELLWFGYKIIDDRDGTRLEKLI